MVEEIPLALNPITITEDFFILSHYNGPEIKISKWFLEVGGLVSKPLRLSYEELTTSYSLVSEVATMECVINKVGGDLVGTASWSGVPMKEILREVGVEAGAEELVLKSMDGVDRAYPLDSFQSPTALLAYEMNSQPLPIDHGFPLRLVVPGIYGFKWRRWLKAIIAIKESDVDPKLLEWQKIVKLEKIALTTKILRPQKDETISKSPIFISGFSWGGESKVSKVEVSFDNCKNWTPAEIVWEPPDPHAWVLWRLIWDPPKNGHYMITARAIDKEGRVQIMEGRDDHPSGLSDPQKVNVSVKKEPSDNPHYQNAW